MSKKLVFVLMIAAVLSLAGLTQGQGQGGRGEQLKLPDGPGKDILQSACTECHNLQMASGTGYNREEWGLTLERMIAAGAKMTPDQIPVVTDYLLKNLAGEGPKPAVVVTGSVAVSFKEWGLPTKGSRPHDPWAAPDGSIWYTGMYANVIGRVDPKTGDIKIVTSPTPRSLPYGMVVSSKGLPFLVEFGAPKVASVDPATSAIKEYALPHEVSRPRRIAITSDDVIWYSDYSRGYLGRLDPKTGAV